LDRNFVLRTIGTNSGGGPNPYSVFCEFHSPVTASLSDVANMQELSTDGSVLQSAIDLATENPSGLTFYFPDPLVMSGDPAQVHTLIGWTTLPPGCTSDGPAFPAAFSHRVSEILR
jgi:hypothetical protein